MAYHHILNKTVESLTPAPSTQPLALSGSLKYYPSPYPTHPLPMGISLPALPTGYGVETVDISNKLTG